MQSIVFVGTKAQQQEYVSEFLHQYKIKPYSLLRIDKKVGIADVRHITKFIVVMPPRGEKKLVVLENEMTIEAQSALLKTLEELPEYISIIIICERKEQLLPTILSRCTIIDSPLSHDDTVINSDMKKFIENFVDSHPSFSHRLLFCEKMVNDSEKITIDAILVFLRNILIRKLNNGMVRKDDILFIYSLLLEINRVRTLIKSNNVNIRFALESTLLNL